MIPLHSCRHKKSEVYERSLHFASLYSFSTPTFSVLVTSCVCCASVTNTVSHHEIDTRSLLPFAREPTDTSSKLYHQYFWIEPLGAVLFPAVLSKDVSPASRGRSSTTTIVWRRTNLPWNDILHVDTDSKVVWRP